jgi:hypothetical protein
MFYKTKPFFCVKIDKSSIWTGQNYILPLTFSTDATIQNLIEMFNGQDIFKNFSSWDVLVCAYCLNNE